jgi:hypothetical protein
MTPNDIAAVKKELREKVDAANRGLEYGITLHIDAFLTILDSHDKLEAENKALLADVAALRAPLEQIRNSMCSIGLSLPPLLQSVEQMLDSPNPGQALLDERDTLAAENALLRGRLEAAEKVVSAAEKHRDDVRMCCPECGSEEFFQRPYDFGRDPETGYHDSGVRATCHKCSHDADIEDFQHLELAQGIRHWLSVYLAKYATPKEPTDA